MEELPEELWYTSRHLWIRMEEDFLGVCGITDAIQERVSGVVYIEMPEINQEVKPGERIGVVETVMSLLPIYSPVTGTIVEVNDLLEDSPDLVTIDPYGQGWVFKVDVKYTSELDLLLSAKEYAELLENG